MGYYAHISELHPRWLKMGRKMRPLSAASHQARCGQMGEEFPEYAIERRRDRAIRPIGRGVQRKRAHATHLSPVRLMISRCSGDGPANAFRGKPHAIRNMLSQGRHPTRPTWCYPGNAFPAKCAPHGFPGKCVPRESPVILPGKRLPQPKKLAPVGGGG